MKPTIARFRPLLLALALALPSSALPLVALAQSGDAQADAMAEADGRLRGYEESNVFMRESSTALTYAAFIALAVLAAGVMFKASGRTHLD